MKKSKSWLILPLILLFLNGCATRQHQIQASHIPPQQETQIQPDLSQKLTDKRQTIVDQAIENLDKPYKWGGHSPDTGFDCSGLVVHTYSKAGIRVPRTAKNQFKEGRSVPKQGLTPGDLVFFNTPEKKTGLHVGIFIGNSQFIHAPGRGRRVRVASLENPYFKQHFKGAKSYL